jgi:hypothetical protein
MAYSKDVGRQYALVAEADVSYGDLTSGSRTELIDLPAGSRIIRGEYLVYPAFDSATSDAVTITDDADTPVTYVDDTDAQVADRLAFTMPDDNTNYYAEPATIGVTWTGAGGSTSAGTVRVLVEYTLEGRALETQPEPAA